ncbi:helix-turn-helix transcriptional regulator [Haloarchaeobius amylolyticus]|uniref:Helix-turn-helix transcriptional regulator n=1 Tax=Haloarchaeobius amylolyticus TaxID=1198296 RepID=A0ABD6BEN7_9EURY
MTTEAEAETFEDYANEVSSGQRTEPYNRQLFQPHVDLAAESTGRDMTIENAGWDDPRIERIENEGERSADAETVRVGIMSYSFTWTNFATVDGDRIHAGDTLRTAGLFRTLDSGQRLIIEPPDNYGFVEAPTSTVDGALVWNGPHQFDTDSLEITIIKGAGSGLPPSSGTGWLIASALGLVILVGGGAYLVTRRTEDADDSISVDRLLTLEHLRSLELTERLGRRESPVDDSGSTGTAEDGELANAAAESPEPYTNESGTHLEFEESDLHDIDPELLSDEERVLRLLKQNGGRMKQASIVSETGWSNAKVSQLLSKMDDDDEIEKLRIGRENLITLPGVDLTDLD